VCEREIDSARKMEREKKRKSVSFNKVGTLQYFPMDPK
jgi:hypothetical protein